MAYRFIAFQLVLFLLILFFLDKGIRDGIAKQKTQQLSCSVPAPAIDANDQRCTKWMFDRNFNEVKQKICGVRK
jgi:hypothetical protein